MVSFTGKKLFDKLRRLLLAKSVCFGACYYVKWKETMKDHTRQVKQGLDISLSLGIERYNEMVKTHIIAIEIKNVLFDKKCDDLLVNLLNINLN